MSNHPKSRRARALRALGITIAVAAAIVAAPIILMRLYAEAKGDRR
nr:hypothetical protein [uncultured Sphingomonas sp.]